jgi:hypothetical protein
MFDISLAKKEVLELNELIQESSLLPWAPELGESPEQMMERFTVVFLEHDMGSLKVRHGLSIELVKMYNELEIDEIVSDETSRYMSRLHVQNEINELFAGYTTPPHLSQS